ncbi:MAG: hypothetical protein HXX13_14215 [Bacteroidetes bacterium]|nr:hypothetical protein [Bacteroidota bacterium]
MNQYVKLHLKSRDSHPKLFLLVCNIKGLRRNLLVQILAFLSCVGYAAEPDSIVVGYVDQYPVLRSEFIQRANQLRYSVIQKYRREFNSAYDSGFWERSYEGPTPAELLKRKTLDTIVSIKVQQMLAIKNGIAAEIGYTDFLAALEKENARRLKAKAKNEVIYGPVQYSEDVYFSYRFSNMVNELKEKLAANEHKMDDAFLAGLYERDRDSLYKAGNITSCSVYRISYNDDEDPGIRKLAMLVADTVRRLFISGIEPADSAGLLKWKFPAGLECRMDRVVFNDSVYSPEEENTEKALVKQVALKLGNHSCSKILETGNVLLIISVNNKQTLGFRSYEKCRGIVRSRFIDNYYEQYIGEAVRKTKVKVNTEVYNAIKFN